MQHLSQASLTGTKPLGGVSSFFFFFFFFFSHWYLHFYCTMWLSEVICFGLRVFSNFSGYFVKYIYITWLPCLKSYLPKVVSLTMLEKYIWKRHMDYWKFLMVSLPVDTYMWLGNKKLKRWRLLMPVIKFSLVFFNCNLHLSTVFLLLLLLITEHVLLIIILHFLSWVFFSL